MPEVYDDMIKFHKWEQWFHFGCIGLETLPDCESEWCELEYSSTGHPKCSSFFVLNYHGTSFGILYNNYFNISGFMHESTVCMYLGVLSYKYKMLPPWDHILPVL